MNILKLGLPKGSLEKATIELFDKAGWKVNTMSRKYFPEDVGGGWTAQQAAVSVVPGAFGKGTTLAMLQWGKEKGYDSDEPFQKYLQRKLEQ